MRKAFLKRQIIKMKEQELLKEFNKSKSNKSFVSESYSRFVQFVNMVEI